MSYYRHHVFFCINRRDDGSACCADGDARALRDYAKGRSKELGLAKPGGVRINTAGCMNRCGEGPVMVVYPEAVWYRYANRDDVDEIIARHLIDGEPVDRLRI
ncbi:(2Fe-2S) ferredoxin domain-containing protein [Endothiovibrio diazotrophicus]